MKNNDYSFGRAYGAHNAIISHIIARVSGGRVEKCVYVRRVRSPLIRFGGAKTPCKILRSKVPGSGTTNKSPFIKTKVEIELSPGREKHKKKKKNLT